MEIIKLSELAQRKALKHAFKNKETGKCLRVAVIGGGCSGLQYKLGIDDKKDGDTIHEYPNGLKVVVDEKSAPLLDGTSLEFQEGLQSGFEVVNPNAESTCGCGKSFC